MWLFGTTARCQALHRVFILRFIPKEQHSCLHYTGTVRLRSVLEPALSRGRYNLAGCSGSAASSTRPEQFLTLIEHILALNTWPFFKKVFLLHSHCQHILFYVSLFPVRRRLFTFGIEGGFTMVVPKQDAT